SHHSSTQSYPLYDGADLRRHLRGVDDRTARWVSLRGGTRAMGGSRRDVHCACGSLGSTFLVGAALAVLAWLSHPNFPAGWDRQFGASGPALIDRWFGWGGLVCAHDAFQCA